MVAPVEETQVFIFTVGSQIKCIGLRTMIGMLYDNVGGELRSADDWRTPKSASL
jgi:hypothetical protein